MAKTVIPFTTHADWLAARLHDITSTESAALFNASPYVTAFELYYAKKSGEVEQRADSPRMKWGRRLQDSIALGVAEDYGVIVRKMSEYIRDDDARLGASFDFQIIGANDDSPVVRRFIDKGLGLMEVKTVDPSIYNESWLIVDGEAIEAPPHIELQVQHQMLLSGAQWALIVALIGGNRVSVIEREYDADLCAAIVQKAREFWSLVERGTPPSPDYTRDASILAAIYLSTLAGKVLDARDDDRLSAWVEQYQTLGAEIRVRARERDAMRARILERIGDAARVLCPHDVTISAATMQGCTVPAYVRSPFRTLRISTHKETT